MLPSPLGKPSPPPARQSPPTRLQAMVSNLACFIVRTTRAQTPTSKGGRANNLSPTSSVPKSMTISSPCHPKRTSKCTRRCISTCLVAGGEFVDSFRSCATLKSSCSSAGASNVRGRSVGKSIFLLAPTLSLAPALFLAPALLLAPACRCIRVACSLFLRRCAGCKKMVDADQHKKGLAWERRTGGGVCRVVCL